MTVKVVLHINDTGIVKEKTGQERRKGGRRAGTHRSHSRKVQEEEKADLENP